ncbi:hypothetical protein L6452_19803 [Arctium lappa]|uniref:Uncharacterized protein n=1 Tax=Arctium lappa TaxID=4217 RepID=A0ACB9B9Y9_ARCLA|nr:hypothetical protein L6452_19803 [Arctium lappa]
MLVPSGIYRANLLLAIPEFLVETLIPFLGIGQISFGKLSPISLEILSLTDTSCFHITRIGSDGCVFKRFR